MTLPPWLKAIEERVYECDIHSEHKFPYVSDGKPLLELAKRAIDMATEIGLVLHDEIMDAKDFKDMYSVGIRRGQIAREFLEWVKNGH